MIRCSDCSISDSQILDPLVRGIELENFVYFKNETHYIVMTAVKRSLLKKGVLLSVSTHIEDFYKSGVMK